MPSRLALARRGVGIMLLAWCGVSLVALILVTALQPDGPNPQILMGLGYPAVGLALLFAALWVPALFQEPRVEKVEAADLRRRKASFGRR